MSNAPPPSPAKLSRQHLSLGELFCLTTLAAVTLAIVLYREWTTQERWLLGLTLGGTLSGILVARMCGRAPGRWGIATGSLGSAAATAVICRDWFDQISSIGPPPASRALEYGIGCCIIGAVTIAVGAAFVLLTVAAFRFLSWAADAGPHGMVAQGRKYPVRRLLGICLASLALVILLVPERILSPTAWSPRYFIPIKRPPGEMYINNLRPLAKVALSHHGDWLMAYVEETESSSERRLSVIYRLDSEPNQIQLKDAPRGFIKFGFSCEDDRLAYIEFDFETKRNRPLRVINLATLESTSIDEVPLKWVETLHWLPGNRIVLTQRDRGFTVFENDGKEWSQRSSENEARFNPRLGQMLRFESDCVEVFDPKTMQKQSRVDLQNSFSSRISADGRFALALDTICDLHSKTEMATNYKLLDFTRHGQVVAVPKGHNWISAGAFRADVKVLEIPFFFRPFEWWRKERIRLLDPGTGREVARTQRLGSRPDAIEFSHDGARMAVFNDDGIYIYDVPVEFR